MERFRNISNKVFAVLAVALILCMTCVTAFADTKDWTAPGTYDFNYNNGESGVVTGGYRYVIDCSAITSGSNVRVRYAQSGSSDFQDFAKFTAAGDSVTIDTPADGTILFTLNGGGSYSGTITVTEPVDPINPLDLVGDLGGSMWSLGTSLVGWMTTPANAIVLIGVGLFVLVAVVGGIRRLIVG